MPRCSRSPTIWPPGRMGARNDRHQPPWGDDGRACRADDGRHAAMALEAWRTLRAAARPGACRGPPLCRRRGRAGRAVRAIEGDRIRLARDVFAKRSALIAGVTRHADFILIEDAAREAGYRPAATIYGRARQCGGHECQPGWQSLGRMARMAGGHWVEALAEFAVKQGGAASLAAAPLAGGADAGLVLGWVLAPR